MTNAKKTVHAAHTKHITEAADAATTTEVVAAPPPEIAATRAPDPATLATAVQTALALVRQAQNALPLTAGPGEKARKASMSMMNMPLELLTEAGTFLAQNGSKYPFDAELVQEAAQLETQLDAVVSSAQALISRAQGTVLDKRGPAVEQALALYATLKAQSRTDASVRDTVTRMEPLVNTRKAPHQKKEQRVKAKAKKIAQLTGAAPAEGAATQDTTAPVATPAPIASPAAGAPSPAAGTAPTHS